MKVVPSIITPEYRIQSAVEFFDLRAENSKDCMECDAIRDLSRMLMRATCGGRVDVKDVETLLVNIADQLEEAEGVTE